MGCGCGGRRSSRSNTNRIIQNNTSLVTQQSQQTSSQQVGSLSLNKNKNKNDNKLQTLSNKNSITPAGLSKQRLAAEKKRREIILKKLNRN